MPESQKKLASRILAQRNKGKQAPFVLEKFLFKEQLDFVADPARFVTACCSVRSGKTVACAADLVNTALTVSNSNNLYITLARSSAKRIVWPELKRINKEFKLGFKFNETELSVTAKNDSKIYCMGANTEVEVEKIRGMSRVAVAYLDEAQAFRPHIKELVQDVIIKRLYDLNGRLRVIGTPGPLLQGWFYEICTGDIYTHHHWTMHNNPYLGRPAEELIDDDCRIMGVTREDPAIQRECYGKWVYDPNSLLLQYKPEVNHYEDSELPKNKPMCILGIDMGWQDSDFLSLLGWYENSKITYLLEEIETSNQTTDDLASQIQYLMSKYNIAGMPTDAGGLGKKIVEDLKARYGLPLTPADKLGKMANYKHLGNALRNGTFKAKKDSRFASDCNRLERDREKSTADKIVVKGHSDSVDSALYAFKLSPAYAYQQPQAKPAQGSDDYFKQQEELHLQAAFEQAQKEKNALEGKDDAYGKWGKDRKGIPDWNKW